MDQMEDPSVDLDYLNRRLKELQEKADRNQSVEGGLPSILVLNKVDLVTNKRKMRNLQSELDDLARFDHIFHISCETGFGVEALREYLIEQAPERPWIYDPSMISTKSPVEWAEEALKTAIMEKFFREMPYKMGHKVKAWVPKLDGSIRVDYVIDVRNDI